MSESQWKDVVGSSVQAGAQRRRAQKGVAATARPGEAAVLGRVAKGGKVSAAVQKEVSRAMKKGTALVAASIEHLETAERSWDKFVEDGGHTIDGYPTAELVVTYMVQMSRERQRMCLAQRGVRRKGKQRNGVRNYVAEMGNNLWPIKYRAFGQLDEAAQRQYWAKTFAAYKAVYAAAGDDASTPEDEERVEQLVAQTEEIYKRKHVYRTEIFQLQDVHINEKENVNESLIALAAQSVQQSTAARVGMFTKNRHDQKSARCKKESENPLRVRDVKHKVRKLVLRNAKGSLQGEATSQMQLNWRRVKKQSSRSTCFARRSRLTRRRHCAARRHICGLLCCGLGGIERAVPV